MSSVRLAKSFFEALLLLPLWRIAYKQNPQRAQNLLSLGLMLGLALASLATVWERVAFTGLLNFSSDYRTTAMFWEMHVGGAALDGFLALTVPFAVRELLQARSPVRFGLAATVTALASYACLTTFSRGVYVAVPVGLAILFVLEALQRRRTNAGSLTAPVASGVKSQWLSGALLVLGFGVGAGWMFQTSGYRGAGALLGAMALMLPLARVLRSMPQSHWIAGGMGGVLVATLAVGAAWIVPKGAYVAYVAAFAATAWMIWTHQQRAGSSNIASPISLTGFVVTTVGVVLVAGNWGGASAVGPAVGAAVSCLLLAVGASVARRPLWPETTSWQARVVCVMGVAVAIVGIFSGGAYMGDRFSTGGRDMSTRLAHWKLGVDMLQTPADWWLGKGLGRFPANHFLLGDPKEHPGDFRLRQEKNESYLRLTGGLHLLGHGQLFRATQRVSVPDSPARASAQIRTAKDVNLNFEVCEKHLLYNAGCLERTVNVKAAPGKWQTLDIAVPGDAVSRGAWYAPKLLTFSVALESPGSTVDLDQLKLFGADGRNLLVNGDFSEEMAHWFFSSDKFHLPWHMKNMFLHVLFDQGILGLALWSLLVGGALTRLTVGKARVHPLAPAMVASLRGFAIVGLFDSLLDVPRLAMLFYLLVLIGLTVKIKVPEREREQAAINAGDGIQYKLQRVAFGGASGRLHKKKWGLLFASALTMGLAGMVMFLSEQLPSDLSRTPPALWIRESKPWLDKHDWLAAALLPPLEWIQGLVEPAPLPPAKLLQTTGARPLGVTNPDTHGPAVVIQVGAKRAIKKIADAALFAKAGAIIEVDAGEYVADVAVWTQDKLSLRAVGGRVKLIAANASAEGKAIWVMRGGEITIEGFDFVGARVPDRNGAGVRFEQGILRVRDCTFTHNENGILTGNQADAQLEIENSEFAYNGYGDGLSHNLYVGAIARLSVKGSYFHHAKAGHLLKSRSASNHIFYNRLTDETGGSASYELEFANGGIAYVVGNIIQQGSQTGHRRIVSFGAEGNLWPRNELYLVNNTVVDNRPQGGVFLYVKTKDVTVSAVNNLLVGRGKLDSAAPGSYLNNFTVDWDEFEQASREDYRLKRGSNLAGKALQPGSANGINLQPQAEYVHPRSIQALIGKAQNPGALQSMLKVGAY